MSQCKKDKVVTVQLRNQTLRVNCADGEELALSSAVALVNQHISKVLDGNPFALPEQVALLAGLNMAYELASLQDKHAHDPDFNQCLLAMKNKMDIALNHAVQLELDA